MEFIAEIFSKYGDGITATGVIGFLALYLNRKGQRETFEQQKAVNKLTSEKQNFELLQELAEQYRNDAIDERKRRKEAEDKCSELQFRFIGELERYADRIFPTNPPKENQLDNPNKP